MTAMFPFGRRHNVQSSVVLTLRRVNRFRRQCMASFCAVS